MTVKKLIYSVGRIDELKRKNGYIKCFLTDDLLKKIKDLNQIERELKLYKSLEQLYLNRKYYFFYILDELILKGINIYGNPNFKKITSQEFKYLLEAKENTNRYLGLNWEELDLENLTELFDIKSDLFFNNLPIERFKYFNEELTDEKIIYFFQKRNFKIINLNDNETCRKKVTLGEIEVKDKCTLIDVDVLNLLLEEEKEFLTKKEEILTSTFELFKDEYLNFIKRNPQIKGKEELKELISYLSI